MCLVRAIRYGKLWHAARLFGLRASKYGVRGIGRHVFSRWTIVRWTLLVLSVVVVLLAFTEAALIGLAGGAIARVGGWVRDSSRCTTRVSFDTARCG